MVTRKVEPNEGDTKDNKEKEKEKRNSKHDFGEPFALFAPTTKTRHKFLAHSPEDRGKWIKALKDTIAEHNVSTSTTPHHTTPYHTHALFSSHIKASETSRRSILSRGTMSSRRISYFFFHTYLGRGILISLLIFCLICLGFILFNLWLFFTLTQPTHYSIFPPASSRKWWCGCCCCCRGCVRIKSPNAPLLFSVYGSSCTNQKQR